MISGMANAKFSRIKNIQKKKMVKDFSFNSFSFFVLSLFLIGGLILQFGISNSWEFDTVSSPESLVLIEELVQIASAVVAAAILLALFSSWALVILLNLGMWIGVIYQMGFAYMPLLAIISLGLFTSAAFELVNQWDKVVILRVGKFRKVHGPGLFILIPLMDRIAAHIDTRIRATDFSAEKTLTKDTVPVHVDALCFWMIWDARKAILEVENFMEAVTLSAQTALRDAIGQHELATLLSDRTELTVEIQKILESKTNPWGISILSVEFTDIVIPKELEDAMSKQAQAERERQSRVILGTAEVEIAEKFALAAEKYKDNPTALQLRAMNMVYEGIRKNSTMMLLPSSALDQMNLGATLGTAAFAKEFSAEAIAGSLHQTKNGKESNPVDRHQLAEGGSVSGEIAGKNKIVN